MPRQRPSPLAPGAGAGRKKVRILFTCAGRRIELIAAFLRAGKALGLEVVIHTADTEEDVAAACIADHAHQVPQVESSKYIPTLEELARRHKIDLVIPLLDVELAKLAHARAGFARFGCGVMIASTEVIQTCRDKMITHGFLLEHGIDSPRTWRAEQILKRRRHEFPYFLKPRSGSASKGNHVIHNKADLEALVPYVPDPIIQEFIPGDEYTLDVYAGFDGKPRCVVPRRRLEIRGGEVTKDRTCRHAGIIDTGVRVVEALEECVGVITIQLFLRDDGRIFVIEINPRFGGGVPLSIYAGADFPRWLLSEWLGRKPRIRLDQFRDNVTMLRYHESFFKEDGVVRRPGMPGPKR